METLLVIIGAALIIVGLIGSMLPVLPGPPLSYGGLLLLQLTSPPPFSTRFMVVWAVLVIAVVILDNVIPAYGTKRFGGSSYGVGGSIVGLVAGIFFFPPVGLVVGPLVGAYLGEVMAGRNSGQAVRSAMGSFAGFLAGTLLKVIASAIMGYYFFTSL